MKINQVTAKSIITKSNIPGIDYVINPYVGCQHACIYCYAEFMRRFTGHSGETWGDFLDVKQYDWEKIKPAKYNEKTILLSSVTDPYTPLEIKYENTRRILEKLVETKAEVEILTKSNLVVRDIDLFKQFKNFKVGISLNTLDEEFARIIEPRASKPIDRLQALQKIASEGIPTYVFISPIFPVISDWREIIDTALPITREFHFENLNFRGHNIPRIMNLISERHPQLKDHYQDIRRNPSLWNEVEDDIDAYCKMKNLEYKIEFHHGGFSKTKQ